MRNEHDANIALAAQADRRPQFYVTADIEYLDGNLAGCVIPSGQRTMFPNRSSAMRQWNWLATTFHNKDFIRAAVTGDRYVMRSFPKLEELKPL